ncbi:hypothetical protein E2C01_099535 [Portunus trituberculatus]|uniref:Uncharacterized protein n=1 Tax=Portunus trituberculatus TaxID=210409 RepID=A0A5B7KF83_PORTR|nr:hypothetical protein [Portunus trituberculatus]
MKALGKYSQVIIGLPYHLVSHRYTPLRWCCELQGTATLSHSGCAVKGPKDTAVTALAPIQEH